MSFFSSFKFFTGMLFGPDDLWESRENIISDISIFVSWSQEKGICVWIRQAVCVMFWWKFDIRVCFLSYRSEVIIKDITHSFRICNGFIIKLNWMRYCSCDIFNWDYSSDSFPSIFNVISIVFKIFCIINLLTLFH